MSKNINIVSKITPETAEQLDRIRKMYGFSSNYEILQYLLSAFLKHADPGGGREEDSTAAELAGIFENYENASLRATITAPKSGSMMVLSSFVCVYRIGDAGSKRKVIRLYSVGEQGLTSSVNEDEALLTVLRALRPGLERNLRSARRERGDASILDTIGALLQGDDAVSNEVTDMMSEAANAQIPQYGRRTKKIKSKSVSDG